MVRSRFIELIEEEKSLSRGATRAFATVADLGEMLKARAAFATKVAAAFKAGALTRDQHDKLIALNRSKSLPRKD